MNEEFVLEGLFLHLVREGFRLGIRDYQDALRALQGGYGTGSRQNLLWLCQALWARSNEEIRQLDLLFRRFPFPSTEEVKAITGEQKKESLPIPHPPSSVAEVSPPPQRETTLPPQERSPLPAIKFAQPTQKGIGLSRAQVERKYDEVFILTRRPIVSLRALIIIWRRFRSARREGPKVEIDLDATINEQCRLGFLEGPVLIPARRNQAKLIALIDVSNSMLPWYDFQQMVVESLHTGQLGRVTVYYFHNAPADDLYERETLTRPIKIEKVLKEHPSSTVLIFSDAGAARGRNRTDRVEETADFFAKVWRHWQPIVWMNPMPPLRWKHSSADRISKLAHNTMFQLNEEGLVKAIDVLRGKPKGVTSSYG